VPEAYIAKSGARIKSLADPTRKMSKSDDENSFISLLDAPDVVLRKFKRAVTDSDTEIRYDVENKPGVSGLLEIYANTCGIPIEDAAEEFSGKNYGHLKTTVGEAVVENIILPIQERYNRLLAEDSYLEDIWAKNAEIAAGIGEKMLKKVKKKIGFTAK